MAFVSASRRVTANQFGAALLTTRFRAEQLLFELLGFVERKMAGSSTIINCLPDESRAEMSRD